MTGRGSTTGRVKVACVTKTYRFCAGHRLFDPRRDDAWNLRVFGKCSYPGGHGHNYTLEVTVRGPPDPETGRVVREEDLDRIVEAEVLEKLDHRNLNDALSRELGPAPTTEVLILELWRALEPRLREPAALHRLKVSETEKNSFEYFGPGEGDSGRPASGALDPPPVPLADQGHDAPG